MDSSTVRRSLVRRQSRNRLTIIDRQADRVITLQSGIKEEPFNRMIRSTPHKKSTIHADGCLLAISLIGGLFGLTQEATADSSAASPHTNASQVMAGDFRASYGKTRSPRLRELDQVLQQRSV